MSSLTTDKHSLPPEGWNLKWENPDEIKKQEEIKKKEHLEEFNNWKNKHMNDYNEEELKKKKLHLYMGQRESTYLGNIFYRIRQLFNFPDISLSREERIHLKIPLEKEEKNINNIKSKEQFKKKMEEDEEKRKRYAENDKIQQMKRKEDEKIWNTWYETVKNNKILEYSRSKNSNKKKEKFNKLLEDIYTDYYFSKRINYISGYIEKLSDEKKVNLLLIHKKELKEKKKQKKKDKIGLFIKNEEALEKECEELGITYIPYEKPIPKDQWRKMESGNQWYDRNSTISSRYINMKRKLNYKKKIKQFIDDEIKKEENCNKIGIKYIPYEKPIPKDLNYNWTSKNSSYISERNKKMERGKKKIELNKEWNKINYEERKKIIKIFKRIAKEKEDEILKIKKQQEANQLKYKMKNQLKNAFNSYLYKNFYKLKVINKKEIKRNICFKKIIEYINDKNIKEKFNVIINSENKKNIDEYLNCDEIDNIINDLLEKKKQDNLPWPRKEYSGEFEAIGNTGGVVHRYKYVYKDGTEKLESMSSYRERKWEERQNQNPHN